MFVPLHFMYSATFVGLHCMFSAMFVELYSMYNVPVRSSNYTVRTALCPSRYIACAVMFFQCTALRSSGFTIQYILC
jgi:hypothetical protein